MVMVEKTDRYSRNNVLHLWPSNIHELIHLDFAVNYYGKPDVATSMYAADQSAQVVERHGHRLLQCQVGDSLPESFWPLGTGCLRGFFSAMDAMWLTRQLESGKMSVEKRKRPRTLRTDTAGCQQE